ncbi:MAG: radical SAM protein [Planctomycetes bacterium]|nr:radical SAM protein [Planctomycetota bacterium]MCB9887239.1 radical SAM protein [Planctomycetota bacterium]
MASDKRRIYLGEFNLLMNGSTYLPLVSGLLRANAQQSPIVAERFDWAPFLFHNDRLEAIVDRYERPAVAAFSSLMWNAQLSLKVAEQVKRRHPDCLVVFGGANVPHHPQEFLAANPFIDVAVRGEGEATFTAVLEKLAAASSARDVDLDGIAGTSWRTQAGEFRHNEQEQGMVRDLDAFASPYLEGLFDDLFVAHPELAFQAIIETNRGCPFQCTFCYWGKGGLSRKYRFHGIDRVKREIDWMAEKKIRYVFNADSNFGMHRRDMEIAEYLVQTKQRTGFPHKFRTCYGKNTDEKIFAIGKLFHEHELEKGITISYQSVDEQVQKNIKRDNIRLDRARELQRRFNDLGVPVYTELILGLPGETLRTWIDGVDRILSSGLKNQLFMYICQVFPNTDLAAPDYRERFGLQTKTITLTEIHGRLRTDDWVAEEEEIVVATAAMPEDDWRRALVFSWVTMTMHSLKLGFFVIAWLVDRFGIRHSEFLEFLASGDFDEADFPRISAEIRTFERKVEALRQGRGRGVVMADHGGIYWDEEEASFLRLSRNFEAFYEELRDLTVEFLDRRKVEFDTRELDEVVRYQSLAIPRPSGRTETTATFECALHDYFTALFSTEPQPLRVAPQRVLVQQPEFAGDLPRFARETILWGRKSGTMLTRMAAVAEAPALAPAEVVGTR